MTSIGADMGLDGCFATGEKTIAYVRWSFLAFPLLARAIGVGVTGVVARV